MDEMLRNGEKTQQECDGARRKEGSASAPHSFLSYRNRLRRRLAPVLILAIGGIAAVVGRGSRMIAAKVLGGETRSYLVVTSRRPVPS